MTSSERGNGARLDSRAHRFIGGVAALLNAATPLTIGDTLYHALAGQIARHPLDPHGFTFNW